MQWVAKNPTQVSKPNVLLLGDLNSYAKEDPILALEQANYKVLLNDEKIGQGKTAYSYVFGVASNTQGYGGAGNLDHAIADAALYPLVKKRCSISQKVYWLKNSLLQKVAMNQPLKLRSKVFL